MMETKLEKIAQDAVEKYAYNFEVHACPLCYQADKCGAIEADFRSDVGFDRRTMEPVRRKLYIPYPVGTVWCLGVLMHEIGHIALGHAAMPGGWGRDKERAASEWAFAELAKHSIPVPKDFRAFAREQWLAYEAIYDEEHSHELQSRTRV